MLFYRRAIVVADFLRAQQDVGDLCDGTSARLRPPTNIYPSRGIVASNALASKRHDADQVVIIRDRIASIEEE